MSAPSGTTAPTPILGLAVTIGLPPDAPPERRRAEMRKAEASLVRAAGETTGWPPAIVRAVYRIAWETLPVERQGLTLMRALLLTQLQFAERARRGRERRPA
jgi:hypothetical protein